MNEDQNRETPSAPLPAATPLTGHAGVDEVLAAMGELDDLPVSDHVAIFDRAHEGLRRALNEAGQGQPADA